MNKVGFGFIGSKLDAMGGFGEKRHSAWRPTVSFALDKSLVLNRLELWYDKRFEKLAMQTKDDIQTRSSVEVNLKLISIRDPWNFEEVYGFLFDFANEYSFQPDKNEYYVHLTTGTHVAQICLFLLTESRIFPAKLVQTSPRGESNGPTLSIIDLDLSRYDKLAQRFEKKLSTDLQLLKAGINTRNKEFNKLISEIELVARSSKEPMLILGPTGAGKSHLAKQIFLLKQSQHQLSGDFIDINCATIRGDQAMSALFGHAKGSFTGALSKRDGLLKRANNGLLFLDEIGELGLDEQAMLLRALEEKTFLPLGSDEPEKSDFQLIAGTNCDLNSNVSAGKFREDLLFRINTWSFKLPGLKERREDIEPNIDYELMKFEQSSGRRISFSAEGRTAFLKFSNSDAAYWPGNFRDLNASIIRMSTLAPQGRITLETVNDEIQRLKRIWGANDLTGAFQADQDAVLHEAGIPVTSIDLFEKAQLVDVILTLRNSSSIAEAGRKLFSVSRQERSVPNDSDRLRKYLSKFGLNARQLTS